MPVHAGDRERRNAREWVDRLVAGGGTEMISAIEEALRPLRADATRQVVIVTDGQIGFEAGAIRAIRDGLPNGSRLHTVGVGSAANRAFLRPAAKAGRGVEVMIGLDEPAAPGAERILAATHDPDIVDVTVGGTALLDAPPRLPDLLAGSPVLTGIRLRPNGGTLVVSGRTAHGAWEERVDVPATEAGEGSDAISALWAREAIENLELDLACGGTRKTIDAQIEAIALRHSIASRLTSWIAVADVPSVDPREPVRVERIPQMLPYGMSAEGLGLVEQHQLLADASVDMSRAVPRQVMRTSRRERQSAVPPQELASFLGSELEALRRSELDERQQLVESLREPIEKAIETARRDLERFRRLVAEFDEFASHLLRDLRRLDVPTREAAARRHELLDRLEHLVSQAQGTPLAGPLTAVRDRLRDLVLHLERGGQTQTLTLRGHVLPTPGRPTTTIEIFMTSDLAWSPASTATVASRSVDIVESGTTRPGEIAAGSLVRVELSAAGDDVTQFWPVRNPEWPQDARGDAHRRERRATEPCRPTTTSKSTSFGAIAGRDAAAFTRWFARCEIPLKQSLQSFAELVDVESVVQDAAFKVWQNASNITPDGRPGFLLRWAKRVALNEARSKIRRSDHRPDHREPLTEEEVDRRDIAAT